VVLVVKEDDSSTAISTLTGQILAQHPNVPVIQVGLDRNVVCLYTSSTLPARSRELFDAIRRAPARPD
jgi:hypothetical protein